MKPIPLPSRESSNTNQLSALLVITQYLQAYLIMPPTENMPKDSQLDGGTVAAAATTFIKVCSKIDELLDDKSRWSLEAQDELYSALVKVQEEQQKFLQAQTSAAKSIERPSFQLKPLLAVVENGYVAVYGNLTDGAAVVGYGPTPSEAFADFDAAWSRRAEQQHKILPVTESPAVPEEKPKRKKKQ